jgi:hypothetical protein
MAPILGTVVVFIVVAVILLKGGDFWNFSG